MSKRAKARLVVEACLKAGIREFVVCAGARNLALVETLTSSEELVVWSHFEERAAGFFALGRCMDSCEPCAIVTTSGTAVAELLPAVIEAHYQARPLVLITADRPAAYRGSGAPQSIEQVGIFQNYVAGVDDIQTGDEGVLESWKGGCPWHINVCLEENEVVQPLEVGCEAYLRPKERFEVGSLRKFCDDSWRGLVVCVGGLEPEDQEEVWEFLRELKAPVIADATSGLREMLGGLLLADPERMLAQYKPKKVIRIGEVPVGRFWRDLEDQLDVDVLSICRSGYSGLARPSEVIRGDVARVLRGAGSLGEVGDVLDMLKESSRRWSQIDELLECYPDSEPGLVRGLSIYASVASSLYLGNSLPIREWGQFGQREYPIPCVRANRGANGIDGQIATWAGLTYGLDDSWCVVGDLTAIYDLSAPSLLHDCDASGRVLVVINNGGGRIFERLPRVRGMKDTARAMVVNEHTFSFEAWAAMWGMDYQLVESSDELEIEPGERCLLVEIVPCPRQTEKFWDDFAKLGGK